MAKLTLGTKLTCPSCGARFYDLRRPSVACPKCDAPYSGKTNVKPKRTRVPVEAVKQVEEAVVIAAAEPNKGLGASTKAENTELNDEELKAIGDVEDVGSGPALFGGDAAAGASRHHHRENQHDAEQRQDLAIT